MIKVTDSYKKEFLENRESYIKDNRVVLTYSSFLSKFLDTKSKESNISYPYKINVARSVKEMVAGDLSPAYTIEVKSPISYEKNPIWECNTLKSIEAHMGFENGDPRYLSEYGFDDTTPHGTLGGTTGSGKSVTINNIIFNMCYQYPPWELELHMSDAKIAEFRRYGLDSNLPHIKSIAATTDMGYTISILENLCNEIGMWNTVFSNSGAKDLEGFRKKTGLAVPRKLFVMDEYQYLFILAQKKSKVISGYLDTIGRVGRNAGIHMFLASQEVGSEVKSILPNMKLRMCLRAGESVSEMLLGNNRAAMDLPGKGLMYMNVNPDAKNMNDNRKMRVPYQSDEEFAIMSKFLDEAGKQVGFRENLNFYDENRTFFCDEIYNNAKEIGSPEKIILGEPSFINKKDSSRLYLDFDFKDTENILVLTNNTRDCSRYIKTVVSNADANYERGFKDNIFVVMDPSMVEDVDISKYTSFNMKSTDDPFYTAVKQVPYIRNMILECDNKVFSKLQYDEVSEEMYKEFFGNTGLNQINLSRVYYLRTLLAQPNYMKVFGLDSVPKNALDEHVSRYVKKALETIFNLGSEFITNKVTKKNIGVKYIHLVGVHRLLGIGRDYKSAKANDFKSMLMDSFESNTIFVIYATNSENLNEFLPGLRYFIFDKVERDANKFKIDDYPDNVSKVCAVLHDRQSKETCCFKRTALDRID